MSDARAEEFLDLYRRLETAAEEQVVKSGRGSAIFRLEKHPDFAPYAEQLECIREVRNFLSHEPKFDGEYAIHPSARMLETLRTLLRLVENPPLVRDRMTPVAELTVATRQTAVLPLMKEMAQRHLSHAPVLVGKRVESVFSIDTLFQAALDGKPVLSETTVVGDFAEWLPFERHLGQEFRFVSPELPLRDAKEMFDRAYSRNRKLKLLLVTDGARSDSPLLGVLSPYDVLDIVN